MKIKFIVNPKKKNNYSYPYFGLISSDWDDFFNKTRFYLDYHTNTAEGIQKTRIGAVKIMHYDTTETIKVIPNEFNTLSDKFCSLGQSTEYYTKLKGEFNEEIESVLQALNDAAYFEGIKDSFDSKNTFRYSLIRESSAEQALYNAKKIILNIPLIDKFEFKYTCQLKGASDKHSVSFNFGDNPNLPNRIIALVGKNGTGKTQFLANLALDLSGISRKKLKEDIFIPKRPLFSKVIAISYSIFDKFTKPKSDRSFSYKYCGLKDSSGRLMSTPKKSANFAESIEKIILKNLEEDWLSFVSVFLEKEKAEYFYNQFFGDISTTIDFNKIGNELSSGQSFLMYVFTEVIANIKPNSLILFDEPEMHLHPNATANLIRMLEKLLIKFRSFALIATHSPIIIQEIPSRYVRVFDREGNIPMIYNLGIESFGENIEVLTQEVFKTKDVEDNYKDVLKKLSQKFSFKMILSLFDNKLSLTAKTFLLSQYENPESQF